MNSETISISGWICSMARRRQIKSVGLLFPPVEPPKLLNSIALSTSDSALRAKHFSFQ